MRRTIYAQRDIRTLLDLAVLLARDESNLICLLLLATIYNG